MKRLITYLTGHHLLANFIVFFVFLGAAISWVVIGKEELPNIELGIVRVSISYPGASPDDVERLVTWPVEKEIKGISGIDEVRTTSSEGRCSIMIFMDPKYQDKDETVTEIRNKVLSVKLPSEVKDTPSIREFKPAQKAIIDLGLYDTSTHLLDETKRRRLQILAHALETRLTHLPEINEASMTGYMDQEIHIELKPELLVKYNISVSEIMNMVRKHNIRKPSGNMDNFAETRFTVLGELDDVEKLKKLAIRGGFDTPLLTLGQVATIRETFARNTSIVKINGHEGIMMQIRKSTSADILRAQEKVTSIVKRFQQGQLKGSPVKVILLDDESRDVRNRLSLIGWNGLIGFVLILITLFIFLDMKSGIWVAIGIPFAFCFGLIFITLAGYTINNITLAAVIIVMGMLVDDAIVVSENVLRHKEMGKSDQDAAIDGTVQVFHPILASILTTVAAFVPLLFFSGRYGLMIAFIPLVVFLMLMGSLFESTLILPGHLTLNFPYWLTNVLTLGIHGMILRRRSGKRTSATPGQKQSHWFHRVEDRYGRLLERLLKHKVWVFVSFVVLLAGAGWLFTSQMRFVMFPREEATEIRFMGEAPRGTPRLQTAELSRKVERVFNEYLGKEIVGYRTRIGIGRRGSNAEQNKFRLRIELVSKENRSKSLKQLTKEWTEKITPLSLYGPGRRRRRGRSGRPPAGKQKRRKGNNSNNSPNGTNASPETTYDGEGQPLTQQPDQKDDKKLVSFYFARSRFGSDSGSAVEVVVQDNNDSARAAASEMIRAAMAARSDLNHVEIEKPLETPEQKVFLNRELVTRLGIDPSSVASVFRTVLEGTILFNMQRGDEEGYVRLTASPSAKRNLKNILAIPVTSQGDYLVPLGEVVRTTLVNSADSINRKDFQRTTMVYGDLVRSSGTTPLEIANYLEDEVFPRVQQKYPSTLLSFEGEIKMSKESGNEMVLAMGMVVFLIFFILMLLFNSMLKPLVIMLAIPFGMVGVILAFWLHGMSMFGFFGVIGALGLAGVVVNDSIVMVDKLEEEFRTNTRRSFGNKQIADVSKTRLRAVLLTTLTTVAGVMPTAYGIAGYDSMLAEMMLALSWGLIFGTTITLILVPCLYGALKSVEARLNQQPAVAHGGRR